MKYLTTKEAAKKWGITTGCIIDILRCNPLHFLERYDRLHTSVGTVGKRFGEIYALLGVESKAALVELYKQSVSGTVPVK